jgi:fatty-acid desaturase
MCSRTNSKLFCYLSAFVVVYASGFGITAGAHRLWSHRAYKAKWPLRLLLVTLFTVAGQVGAASSCGFRLHCRPNVYAGFETQN